MKPTYQTPLTKTGFLSGLQCEKKLWFEVNKKVEAKDHSAADLLRLSRGQEVDQKARELFPAGVLVSGLDSQKAADYTTELIGQNVPFIFQATFLSQPYLVKADILEKVGSGAWNLTEVKMSSKVKPEHIYDVAFQYYVIQKSGVLVNECFVLHLNKDCEYPKLDDLFTKRNVTNEVKELLAKLEYDIGRITSVLNQDSEPDVKIGKHCESPNSCSFKDTCWKDVPKDSIFTIPRISDKKIKELQDLDIIRALDIPDDFELTATQVDYVNVVKDGKAKIDKAAIKKSLGTLEYPLYFLDFETDAPAIPRLDGMSPYGKIPFQYSLHILSKDGSLEHREFLHTGFSDPRSEIAARLSQDIGDKGTVVAYYASFEREVLNSLAEYSKEHSVKLLSIAARLWDQLEIFSKYYKDPTFFGSNSIKVVLDSLIPKLSHKNIKIQGGADAGALWVRMIGMAESAEKVEIIKGLKEYCHLDTLAMVELHGVLVRL